MTAEDTASGVTQIDSESTSGEDFTGEDEGGDVRASQNGVATENNTQDVLRNDTEAAGTTGDGFETIFGGEPSDSVVPLDDEEGFAGPDESRFGSDEELHNSTSKGTLGEAVRLLPQGNAGTLNRPMPRSAPPPLKEDPAQRQFSFLTEQPLENPPAPPRCGGNVALVIDLSNSINMVGGLGELRKAAHNAIKSIENTPIQLSLVTFATHSPAQDVISGTGGSYGVDWNSDAVNNRNVFNLDMGNPSDVRRAKRIVNSYRLAAKPVSGTNYQAPLQILNEQSITYDQVFFITDGVPTTSNQKINDPKALGALPNDRYYRTNFSTHAYRNQTELGGTRRAEWSHGDAGQLPHEQDITLAIKEANNLKRKGTRITPIMVGRANDIHIAKNSVVNGPSYRTWDTRNGRRFQYGIDDVKGRLFHSNPGNEDRTLRRNAEKIADGRTYLWLHKDGISNDTKGGKYATDEEILQNVFGRGNGKFLRAGNLTEMAESIENIVGKTCENTLLIRKKTLNEGGQEKPELVEGWAFTGEIPSNRRDVWFGEEKTPATARRWTETQYTDRRGWAVFGLGSVSPTSWNDLRLTVSEEDRPNLATGGNWDSTLDIERCYYLDRSSSGEDLNKIPVPFTVDGANNTFKVDMPAINPPVVCEAKNTIKDRVPASVEKFPRHDTPEFPITTQTVDRDGQANLEYRIRVNGNASSAAATAELFEHFKLPDNVEATGDAIVTLEHKGSGVELQPNQTRITIPKDEVNYPDPKNGYPLYEDILLPAGQTVDLKVQIPVKVMANTSEQWRNLSTCNVDSSVGYNGGVPNLVTIEGDVEDQQDNWACLQLAPQLDLAVSKFDSDGQISLPGADFKLQKIQSGAAVEDVEIIRDPADNSKFVAPIGPGKYQLTEIMAPDGYSLLAEPIRFEIKEADQSSSALFEIVLEPGHEGVAEIEAASDVTRLQLNVLDPEAGDLPEAGGSGTAWIILLGLSLVAAGGFRLRRIA
ncbi:SpaA isopeptide-forming pilin-related protein [Corynebacterium cystitidis]|uniref:SpaA isopeptide-forming pilin-related protein n=1 Tax=Corynebacterium cystitidis TaxID=35757 RepID=UPI00211DE81F|nr:SpaA isopeptide-forming pilin-related protein [Corynebacterium cystitidis]